MRTFGVLVVAMLGLAVGAARAETGTWSFAPDLDWSFAAHPHPSREQHNVEELRRQYADQAFYPETAYCRETLSRAFANYNKRYPAFADTGPPGLRHRAWKRHMAETANEVTGLCVYSLPFYEFLEERHLFATAGLKFCGAWPDLADTGVERRFLQLISEIVDLARTGSPDALRTLLFLHTPGGEVATFNPDVEYYLRRALARQDEPAGEPWRVVDIDSIAFRLAPGRRAFVDEAVAAGDLMAVLATTSPCDEPRRL